MPTPKHPIEQVYRLRVVSHDPLDQTDLRPQTLQRGSGHELLEPLMPHNLPPHRLELPPPLLGQQPLQQCRNIGQPVPATVQRRRQRVHQAPSGTQETTQRTPKYFIAPAIPNPNCRRLASPRLLLPHVLLTSRLTPLWSRPSRIA